MSSRVTSLVTCAAAAVWFWLFACFPLPAAEVFDEKEQPAHTAALVRTGGPSQLARLISLEQGQATFRTTPEDGEPLSLSLAQIVRWGHPAAVRSGVQVVTVDGLLVGFHEPEIGFAVEMTAGVLTLPTEPELFGDVELPLARLCGIVFQPPADQQASGKLLDQMRAARGETDRVLLVNGDELTGTVTEISDDQVALTTELGQQELKLARQFGGGEGRVTAIIFNPALRSEAPKEGERILVGFRNGSLLQAARVVAGSERFELEVSAEFKLAASEPDAGLEKLVFLQPLGRGVAYLSDLEPLSYRHIPYLNVAWPFREDRNVLGGRLRAGGKLYTKGLGMHAPSRLAYRLDKPYRRFAAQIAIDDATGLRGSVVFRVYVHRDGKWQPAFASETIRGGQAPVEIAVDLEGAKAITLIVDYADRGDVLDHADWLDAHLVP